MDSHRSIRTSVQDHISALVHEKSVAVDLALRVSVTEYYDHLNRARSDAAVALWLL